VPEENPGRPLFIPGICAPIGVSERTLRTCCQQHLAMSPRRYLRGNRAELFELAEEILHQVALFVVFAIKIAQAQAVWSRRDYGGFASRRQPVEDAAIGIKGAIGD